MTPVCHVDCCHTAIQQYLAWVLHYLLERAVYGTAVMTVDSLLRSAFISLLFLRQDFCCLLSPVKVGFAKNNVWVIFLAPYQSKIRDLEKLG